MARSEGPIFPRRSILPSLHRNRLLSVHGAQNQLCEPPLLSHAVHDQVLADDTLLDMVYITPSLDCGYISGNCTCRLHHEQDGASWKRQSTEQEAVGPW